MAVRLTIKNYRCFVRPTTVDMGAGFTAFVGVNNAGKSTIMRFLLEMRPLLSYLSSHGSLHQSLVGSAGPQWTPQHVVDNQEIFSNLNENPLEFSFEFELPDPAGPAALKRLDVIVNRNLTWSSHLHRAAGPAQTRGVGLVQYNGSHLIVNNQFLADVDPIFQIARILAGTLYIGPFRNTINVGTKTDYLDIQIGEAFIKQFRALKTGPSKANSAGIQKLTEDIQKIFEFDSLDIIPSADDSSLHITVNGKPYKQHELGSGLAQFIVVLANAAIKRPKLILIDEPELICIQGYSSILLLLSVRTPSTAFGSRRTVSDLHGHRLSVCIVSSGNTMAIA
jgi:hypothetical protein